jgi:hypothetical protein
MDSTSIEKWKVPTGEKNEVFFIKYSCWFERTDEKNEVFFNRRG